MQLADDGLVLGVVAGEVGEHSGGAGDDVDVVGAEENDELPQEVVQVVLRRKEEGERREEEGERREEEGFSVLDARSYEPVIGVSEMDH